MGYGGWQLYFEPKLINQVLQLATSFPTEVDTFERYNRISWFIQEQSLSTFPPNMQRVFPPISKDRSS
jgi:hypothetical protein